MPMLFLQGKTLYGKAGSDYPPLDPGGMENKTRGRQGFPFPFSFGHAATPEQEFSCLLHDANALYGAFRDEPTSEYVPALVSHATCMSVTAHPLPQFHCRQPFSFFAPPPTASHRPRLKNWGRLFILAL